MDDAQFMVHVIGEICDYARMNGMEPNETLEAVADNIKALLEIATFSNWEDRSRIESKESVYPTWMQVLTEILDMPQGMDAEGIYKWLHLNRVTEQTAKKLGIEPKG